MSAQDQRTSGGNRPLYVQIQETLTQRIQTGFWEPGQLLPSEMQLAAELGASQGTVRKALDGLADASLIQRQQGKGTFVNEHTEAQVLFRYFHIYDVRGERVIPGVGETRITRRKAQSDIAASLALKAGSSVFEINRLRTRNGQPFMTEAVYLPAVRFPGLDRGQDIPNTLYDMFQKRYGITIVRISEDISPVGATVTQAKALGIDRKDPLLRIDRVARDLEGTPIERRISFANMRGLAYRAELS